MSTVNIPGSPGTAMALAAAVSIYSTAKISKFENNYLTIAFLFMTLAFIVATGVIEDKHIKKDIEIAKIK